MKPTATDSIRTTPATSLPARIGHEVLCAAIAGIFCLFEVLIRITEFRATKILRGGRPAVAELSAKKK